MNGQEQQLLHEWERLARRRSEILQSLYESESRADIAMYCERASIIANEAAAARREWLTAMEANPAHTYGGTRHL
jgi:hypothetical protein